MGHIIIPPTHREDATGTIENQVIECNTSTVSDGYHTFGELYDHRCLLYLAFLKHQGGWKAHKHQDGSSYDGWFLVGSEINGKQISYHLPDKFWSHCDWLTEYYHAPVEWDGHTSQDVLKRIEDWIKS